MCLRFPSADSFFVNDNSTASVVEIASAALIASAEHTNESISARGCLMHISFRTKASGIRHKAVVLAIVLLSYASTFSFFESSCQTERNALPLLVMNTLQSRLSSLVYVPLKIIDSSGTRCFFNNLNFSECISLKRAARISTASSSVILIKGSHSGIDLTTKAAKTKFLNALFRLFSFIITSNGGFGRVHTSFPSFMPSNSDSILAPWSAISASLPALVK